MRIKTRSGGTSVLIARVVVLVLFIGFVWSLSRNLSELKQTDQRLIQAKLELEQVEITHQALLERQQLVETGRFDEIEIRNRLGLVKPGEVVAIVPPLPQKTAPVTLSSEVNEPNLPVWQQWLQLFNLI